MNNVTRPEKLQVGDQNHSKHAQCDTHADACTHVFTTYTGADISMHVELVFYKEVNI